MQSALSLDALIEEGRWLNSCLDTLLSPPEDVPADVKEDVDMCSIPICEPDVESKPDDSNEAAGAQQPGPAEGQPQMGAPAGYWRQRAPLLPARITGRLQEVKGKFGWIWPDRPISHPDANLHEGRIYLSHRDVEVEISGVGAHVSFLLYADGSGLGAMSCRPAETEDVEAAPAEWLVPEGAIAAVPRALRGLRPAPRLAATVPVARSPVAGAAGPPAAAGAAAAAASAAAAQLRREPRTVAPPTLEARLAHRAASLRPAEAPPQRPAEAPQRQPEGPGWRQEGPVRPPAKRPLERNGRARLSETPMTGYVRTWKGNYGWVEPLEAVRHPLFNGKIFLHINDMASAEPPEVGAKVAFLLYLDPDGLGAEHCTLHRASAAPGDRQPYVSPTVVASAMRSTGVSPSGLFAGAAQSATTEPRSAHPGDSQPAKPPPQPQSFAPASAVFPAESPVQVSITVPNVDQDMAKRLAAWMEDREG